MKKINKRRIDKVKRKKSNILKKQYGKRYIIKDLSELDKSRFIDFEYGGVCQPKVYEKTKSIRKSIYQQHSQTKEDIKIISIISVIMLLTYLIFV